MFTKRFEIRSTDSIFDSIVGLLVQFIKINLLWFHFWLICFLNYILFFRFLSYSLFLIRFFTFFTLRKLWFKYFQILFKRFSVLLYDPNIWVNLRRNDVTFQSQHLKGTLAKICIICLLQVKQFWSKTLFYESEGLYLLAGFIRWSLLQIWRSTVFLFYKGRLPFGW